MPAKLTTISFINKSIEVHGDKYDYSISRYLTNKQKTKIICREHGVFSQRPRDHMNGIGCPRCSSLKLSREDFIKRSDLAHGHKYNYKNVEYKSNGGKVSIICPNHGEFKQVASSHMSGVGCPTCAGNKKLTTSEFIRRSINVHGGRYGYSKSVVKNSERKVVISCNDHGDFFQSPKLHLNGSGCSKCTKNGFNPMLKSNLYILRSECGEMMKIGITNNIEKRVKFLSKSTPFSFDLISSLESDGDNIMIAEKIIHSKYESKRIGLRGFNGCTEWFSYDDSVFSFSSELLDDS